MKRLERSEVDMLTTVEQPTAVTDLQNAIAAKTARVGVIGLGYVGLAVACKFAETGFTVVGLERRPQVVELVNAGRMPIQGQEPGLADLLGEVVATRRLSARVEPTILKQADVVVVAVETPIAPDTKAPRYEALKSALTTLGRNLRPGMLVVIESTIAPGTMDKIVRPLLEETSGLQVDRDFLLGHCPERVMPGRLLHNLAAMSRVCGGHTPATSEVMVQLYRHIVRAQIDMADWVTAEMVKTTENAYRDVQIAFANEVARICELVGADVWLVRELVNKSPERNVHLPGAGVGGHCIPKDPWLLVHAADGQAYQPSLIPAARRVNDDMPLHMASLLEAALAEAGCVLRGAKVAVLGYAYLENSDDTRNSPSQSLVEHLQQRGAHLVIHDPYVSEYQGDLAEAVRDADALVVMVRHDLYRGLNLAELRPRLRHAVLIDGRRVFDPEAAHASGFVFRAIGWGGGAR